MYNKRQSNVASISLVLGARNGPDTVGYLVRVTP